MVEGATGRGRPCSSKDDNWRCTVRSPTALSVNSTGTPPKRIGAAAQAQSIEIHKHAPSQRTREDRAPARQSRNPSSAGFQPAVSLISDRQGDDGGWRQATSSHPTGRLL